MQFRFLKVCYPIREIGKLQPKLSDAENWNLWLFKKSVEKWFIVVHVRFQLSTSPKLHGTEVTYGLRQFVNQFILKPQKRRYNFHRLWNVPFSQKVVICSLKGSHKWMAPLSVSGSIPPHSLIRLHCTLLVLIDFCPV